MTRPGLISPEDRELLDDAQQTAIERELKDEA